MFLVLSVLLFTVGVGNLLMNKYRQGLNEIPGPWLATYTNLWRLFVTWGRRPEVVHLKLHKRFGDVVRMGPNFVSITDWDATKKIFSPNSGFIKSDFYLVQQTISHGKRLPSLFNTTDEKYHAKLRRSVAGAYSMSTLVQFEPLVDSTITAFIGALDNRFADKDDASGICNFGKWLHFFAFDVIGELTWSKRLGFVEQGIDIEGIIQKVEEAFAYFAVVGQMPWIDLLLKKNPILLWLGDRGLISSASSPVVLFAAKRMAERLHPGKQELSNKENRPLDFLARFMQEGKRDPHFMNDRQVLALTISSVFAGSDTTAITLRAIFYHLLKNPHLMSKLMTELNEAPVTREDGVVSWNEARKLPYLGAVVQEALRIFPAVGIHLERVVPSSGLEVGGHFIPGGTIVGASVWAIHAKESIFGPDPEIFRPERWLDASESQRTRMNNAIFTFGMGSRTCIGKNISLLEIYKVVPTILMKFELNLADPGAEWSLSNAFFIKQTGFNITINRRT